MVVLIFWLIIPSISVGGGCTNVVLILYLTVWCTLKAIAGEAGVPFFYRAGSEFEEMWVSLYTCLILVLTKFHFYINYLVVQHISNYVFYSSWSSGHNFDRSIVMIIFVNIDYICKCHPRYYNAIIIIMLYYCGHQLLEKEITCKVC